MAVKPLIKEVNAVNLHAQNLSDGIFNTMANGQVIRDLAPLSDSLVNMSLQVQKERATIYQREILLDTILQTSPSAMILTDENKMVLMTNPAAKKLLNHGKSFEGKSLNQVIECQPLLKKSIDLKQQGLLHLPDEHVWHLSLNDFVLNHKKHLLILLKPMTSEIQREEINSWKKLLRVISHELNNSLAPISSLAYSGAKHSQLSNQKELVGIFRAIKERAEVINQFVQGYIQFAKLPPPNLVPINWPRLVNQLQILYDFELYGELPKLEWHADTLQLQQALLNIIRNAHESLSDPDKIKLSFLEKPEQLLIVVQDCGGGMTKEQLQHALVPFYTTKKNGTGIGLSLCREIIEAHGGSITVANRNNGLEVKLTLNKS